MKLSKNQYLRYLLINTLLITQTAGFFPWEYVLNNNQGIEEYKKQSFVKAETLFNQALADNPDNMDIKFNLADTPGTNSVIVISWAANVGRRREMEKENVQKNSTYIYRC